MDKHIPADADPQLTTEEASYLLGRSPDWVRRRIKEGVLRGPAKKGDPQRGRVFVYLSSVRGYQQVERQVRRRVREEITQTETTALAEIQRLRREEGRDWYLRRRRDRQAS